jgi:hypothetical protein
LQRFAVALAGVLAAVCTTVSPAQAAGAGCGPSGYAYAGVQALERGHGISAVLTSLDQPVVESGHVAGWVGVGGAGQGPAGSDEWIQVGLNSLPGTGNTLYYEVTRPGAAPRYVQIATNIPNGRPVRVAVLEAAGRPNLWRVWVDDRPVSAPILLAGSHRVLVPMAMGESWDGGRPACNSYNYRFERVSVADRQGGSWQTARRATVLQDPGFRVIKLAPASFVTTAAAA